MAEDATLKSNPESLGHGRVKVRLAVRSESSQVHILPPGYDPSASALCGCPSNPEWERVWENSFDLHAGLLGVCPACWNVFMTGRPQV